MALTCQPCLDGNPWKCEGKSCANYDGSGFSVPKGGTRGKANPARDRLYKKKVSRRPASTMASRNRRLTPQMERAIAEAKAEGKSDDYIDHHLNGAQAPQVGRLDEIAGFLQGA